MHKHLRIGRPAAVLSAMLAVVLVAGCGGADQPTNAQTETRTITDATGAPVEVPVHPKRVVTINETGLDSALALGVKPVGATNGRFAQEVPPYLTDQYGGGQQPSVVGEFGRPDPERVADAEPDLILAGMTKDTALLEQLKKITPAVVVTTKPTDDWKQELGVVANTLNASDKVGEVLGRYQNKVDETKAKLGNNAGIPVSITRWNGANTGPSYMLNKAFASTVITDLGLKRPQAQLQPEGYSPSEALSLENLQVIDAPWIFLGTLNPDAAAALRDVKTQLPAFAQLGAVKSNHVVNVDGAVWTSRGGPTAASMIIDDVAGALGSPA